jgi:hypothetical protein
MTKYTAENPADQPLHDWMDEIEKAYIRLEEIGISREKILVTLVNMSLIYEERHGDLCISTDEYLEGLKKARVLVDYPPPRSIRQRGELHSIKEKLDKKAGD